MGFHLDRSVGPLSTHSPSPREENSSRDPSEKPFGERSPEILWASLRARLLATIGAERTDRWFGSVRALQASEEGQLILGAPNPFTSEWIEDTYGEVLRALADELEISQLEVRVAPPRLEAASRVPDSRSAEGASEGSGTTSSPDSPEGDRASTEKSGSIRPGTGMSQPAGLQDVSPNLTLDRFIVGPSNRVAYRAGLEAIERPGGHYNPLFIYGGCGLGKTHLLQGMTRAYFRQGERRIRYLPAEGFVNRFGIAIRRRELARFRERFRSLKVLVLDDVQVFSGKEKTQLELLETMDYIAQAGGQVILASDCRPSELEGLAEKLLGRFVGGLVCRVSEPELETRYAILKQESKASGIAVGPETLLYLAERALGNVRELLGAWVRVLAHATLLKESVTIELIDRMLEEDLALPQRVTVDAIIEEVGRRYGVPPIEFRGRSRTRTISLARHVAIYVARILTDLSLSEIGEALGGRRHATTSAAFRKMQKEILADEQLRQEVERILAVLRG